MGDLNVASNPYQGRRKVAKKCAGGAMKSKPKKKSKAKKKKGR